MALPVAINTQPHLTVVQGTKRVRKPRVTTRRTFSVVSRTREVLDFAFPNSVGRTTCNQYLFSVEGQAIPGWPDGTVLMCRKAEKDTRRGCLYLGMADREWSQGRLGLGSGRYCLVAFDKKDEGLSIEGCGHDTLRVVGLIFREVAEDGTEKTTSQFCKDGFLVEGGKIVNAPGFVFPELHLTGTPPDDGRYHGGNYCHTAASMMLNEYAEWRDAVRPCAWQSWTKIVPHLPESVKGRERVGELPEGSLLVFAPKSHLNGEWCSVLALLPVSKDEIEDGLLYAEYREDRELAFFGFGLQKNVHGKWAKGNHGMGGSYHPLVPNDFQGDLHDFSPCQEQGPYFKIVAFFSDYNEPRIDQAGFTLADDGNRMLDGPGPVAVSLQIQKEAS